jgi:hypothetical protein
MNSVVASQAPFEQKPQGIVTFCLFYSIALR